MQNIKVSRYESPATVGWAGWIEPADKSWIAFIALDGSPKFFLHRDPPTGAVLPDDPAARERKIAHLRAADAERDGKQAEWPAEPLNDPTGNAYTGRHENGVASPPAIAEVAAARGSTGGRRGVARLPG